MSWIINGSVKFDAHSLDFFLLNLQSISLSFFGLCFVNFNYLQCVPKNRDQEIWMKPESVVRTTGRRWHRMGDTIHPIVRDGRSSKEVSHFAASIRDFPSCKKHIFDNIYSLLTEVWGRRNSCNIRR